MCRTLNWRAAGLAALLALGGCAQGAERDGEGLRAPVAKLALLQLGRPICGDCCREQVVRAFEGMSGIGRIDMTPGEVEFTVELTSGAPDEAQLVAALVAAGAPGAKVSRDPGRMPAKKQWVVAR